MREKPHVRKEIFGKANSRFFGRCVGLWAAFVVLIALVAFTFNIELSGYWIVETLESFVPSIQRWSQASSNFDVLRAVWIFMVVSAPFLIIYIVANISTVYVDKPIGSFIVYSVFCYIFATTFLDASIFGMDLSDPSESRRYKIFAGSIPGGLLFSLVFGAGFIVFSVIAMLVFLEITGIWNLIRRLKHGK